MKKLFASLTALVCLALCAIAADVNLPRKAPEFAFKVGQEDKLLSQYRGKVVALEFVYTTCPHCQAASHLMTKIQQEYASKGLQCIDVAFNDNADLLADNFAKDYQVGFPVGWATREQVLSFMTFSYAERFVVPQLILIDRKGVIHYQTPPLGDEHSMQESTIRQRIEELLATGTTSTKRTTQSNAKLVAKKG